MKLMPLTQGQFSIVDDEEYAWLSKFKWHYDGRYARRNSLQNEGNRRPIYMHRVIAKPPDGMQIDHIDGNKLNNTRANLRVCTHSENQHNRGIDCDNTSGFKGVSWDKVNRKWRARINDGSGEIWLGRYDTSIEAAQAYDDAARQLHGEFAKINGD